MEFPTTCQYAGDLFSRLPRAETEHHRTVLTGRAISDYTGAPLCIPAIYGYRLINSVLGVRLPLLVQIFEIFGSTGYG